VVTALELRSAGVITPSRIFAAVIELSGISLAVIGTELGTLPK